MGIINHVIICKNQPVFADDKSRAGSLPSKFLGCLRKRNSKPRKRKIFAEKPGEFDPRKYLGPARDELIKMVKYKNEQVLMSAGKA